MGGVKSSSLFPPPLFSDIKAPAGYIVGFGSLPGVRETPFVIHSNQKGEKIKEIFMIKVMATVIHYRCGLLDDELAAHLVHKTNEMIKDPVPPWHESPMDIAKSLLNGSKREKEIMENHIAMIVQRFCAMMHYEYHDEESVIRWYRNHFIPTLDEHRRKMTSNQIYQRVVQIPLFEANEWLKQLGMKSPYEFGTEESKTKLQNWVKSSRIVKGISSREIVKVKWVPYKKNPLRWTIEFVFK